MTIAGYLMLIGGFLGSAFAASMEPIAWAWFVPAVTIAALGVFIIKREAHAHASSDEVLHGNRQDLEESLDNIVRNLRQLRADKDSIPTHEVRMEIDKLFRDDLMRFADAREALKHLYGIQTYADVMSEFAAGERYINRVWSASADGYADEVITYIERAYVLFTHAREQFKTLTA
ncbi:MAG: hypothetical protein KJO55_01825 [Gammaproteobacteria bacterium]|nr:hypothetical protein [Gammaproteobacteria bacterium]